MIILGIDCSTRKTNVALIKEDKIIGEISVELGRKQSTELPLLVERLLLNADIDLNEINYIAVGNGPGYYTGIRTGVAYSSALAEALNIKVIPVSTLLSLSYDLREQYNYIAPVLKARKYSLYCALYEFVGGEYREVIKPTFCKAAIFAERLKKYKDAIIVGADSILYPELKTLPNPTDKRMSGPGRNIAELGRKNYKDAVAPIYLKGAYLREPDIGATVG